MWWRQLLLFVMLDSAMIAEAQSFFKVQVRLVRYESVARSQATLSLCLRDTDETLCLQDPGFFLFNIMGNDVTFSSSIETSSGTSISNTFSFNIPEAQETYEIFLQVNNADGIASFQSDPIQPSSAELRVEAEETRMRTVRQRRLTSLTYSYQVLCSPNYYGPSCSTFCTPVVNSTGNYTCGENGELLCFALNSERPCATTGLTSTGNEIRESSDSEGSAEDAIESPEIDGNDSQANRNDTVGAGGSEDGLSSGETAGIVLSILIISGIVATGAVVSILTYKYQPFNRDTVVSTSTGNPKDVLSNPIYELSDVVVDGSEGPGAPKPRQKSVGAMTASTESNPLYFSSTASAPDPFEQTKSKNSKALVLIPPKHKPQQHSEQPACTAVGGGSSGGDSRAGGGGGGGGGLSRKNDHSASEVKQEKRVTSGFDPYFSYKEETSFLAASNDAAEDPDYEPVEAPEAEIDDDGPDYDNVPDEPDYDNVPDEPDYDDVPDEGDLPSRNAQGITFDDPNYA